MILMGMGAKIHSKMSTMMRMELKIRLMIAHWVISDGSRMSLPIQMGMGAATLAKMRMTMVNLQELVCPISLRSIGQTK